MQLVWSRVYPATRFAGTLHHIMAVHRHLLSVLPTQSLFSLLLQLSIFHLMVCNDCYGLLPHWLTRAWSFISVTQPS
jgi:hypothetical protein